MLKNSKRGFRKNLLTSIKIQNFFFLVKIPSENDLPV